MCRCSDDNSGFHGTCTYTNKKMDLETFRQLAEGLSNIILAKGSESSRIDIVFDDYKKIIDQINVKCTEKFFRTNYYHP